MAVLISGGRYKLETHWPNQPRSAAANCISKNAPGLGDSSHRPRRSMRTTDPLNRSIIQAGSGTSLISSPFIKTPMEVGPVEALGVVFRPFKNSVPDASVDANPMNLY